VSSNPWALLEAREWEAALAAYTASWNNTGNREDLFNRALVLLNMRRWPEAMSDFEQCLSLGRSRGANAYELVGAIHWLMGRQKEAVAWWQSSLKADRPRWNQIARSPALLVYAGVKLGYEWLVMDGLKRLKGVWKPGHNPRWPGILPGMYLGEVSADRPEVYVSNLPVIGERELCQAYFYTGVIALRNGDTALAAMRFRRAAALEGAVLEVEYHLAGAEVSDRPSSLLP